MSAGVAHILCITQITLNFLIILYKTHSWLIIDGFGFGFRGISEIWPAHAPRSKEQICIGELLVASVIHALCFQNCSNRELDSCIKDKKSERKPP